jgi:HSP90 family molecular chaperone
VPQKLIRFQDEQNIGAFGVGFYSVFSVTDEPFVTSGDQWMGFYWKDNNDQVGLYNVHPLWDWR